MDEYQSSYNKVQLAWYAGCMYIDCVLVIQDESNPWSVQFIYADTLTLTGVKMFLTHHYYEGTVSYLPARDIIGTPRDATRCRSG